MDALTYLVVLSVLWAFGQPVLAAPAPDRAPREHAWISIPAGNHRPLFAASSQETSVAVDAVEMMETPVTNAQFLAFVAENEPWRRGRVERLFADGGYLSHWEGPLHVGAAGSELPVTRVSWFAARAYCRHLEARLPSEAEWERAASASETAQSGKQDPAWVASIREWYSHPSSGPERSVGQRPANFWGVRDLHGLIWEWVVDFNSVMVTSDSRKPAAGNGNTFCGAGAVGARDVSDYATFMRTAFRSSLTARRTVRHLGFRCVRDIAREHP